MITVNAIDRQAVGIIQIQIGDLRRTDIIIAEISQMDDKIHLFFCSTGKEPLKVRYWCYVHMPFVVKISNCKKLLDDLLL